MSNQEEVKVEEPEQVTQEPVQEESIASVAQAAPEQTEVKVEQTPIKQEPVKVVQQAQAKPAQTAPGMDFNASIANIKANGTSRQKNLIEAIENYMVEMAPGRPVEFSVGARHQYSLWKTISQSIENSTQEEFNKLWNIILAYFNNYGKTALHDKYIFRFAEFWQWDLDELNAFQRILNIIKLTANPSDRASKLREVSLDRSLAVGFSEEGRQKLFIFYKV